VCYSVIDRSDEQVDRVFVARSYLVKPFCSSYVADEFGK